MSVYETTSMQRQRERFAQITYSVVSSTKFSHPASGRLPARSELRISIFLSLVIVVNEFGRVSPATMQSPCFRMTVVISSARGLVAIHVSMQFCDMLKSWFYLERKRKGAVVVVVVVVVMWCVCGFTGGRWVIYFSCLLFMWCVCMMCLEVGAYTYRTLQASVRCTFGGHCWLVFRIMSITLYF